MANKFSDHHKNEKVVYQRKQIIIEPLLFKEI